MEGEDGKHKLMQDSYFQLEFFKIDYRNPKKKNVYFLK